MSTLLHEFITDSARKTPAAEAIRYRGQSLTYAELYHDVAQVARSLAGHGLEQGERVAIYLPKRFETVIAFFATTLAGGVFVPVNPILKAEQVQHILCDCNARILITSRDRLTTLDGILPHCHDLHTVLLIDEDHHGITAVHDIHVKPWPVQEQPHQEQKAQADSSSLPGVIDTDVAAILYTSGSTGKPKGVILSHRNMVAGAMSVAQYLENHAQDRILAVLPFSFDYGFSQLSTAFHTGACVVLMDYLLPRDVIKAVEREQITGLAAVPPLWIQLSKLTWPEQGRQTLRYITNSGGAMPLATLQALRAALPNTRPYLMYGLTEAFRSTYLPPEEIDRRPGSMGKAIPNADIMVVREDGSPCAPGEPGELVHRGSLVALGYWNDPDKTAERFRPVPGQHSSMPLTEIAVWSGDTVRMDEDGFLYFVSRKDEMIKTSGYRVSPTEVEEVIYATGLVGEAAAIGVTHPDLGQAIVVLATAREKDGNLDIDHIMQECKRQLPGFMVPAQIIERDKLPRNPNGKIDRKLLATEYQAIFS